MSPTRAATQRWRTCAEVASVRAGKSEPPISGQSGKTSADAVAVTCDPNSSSAKVAAVGERREQREALARAATADPRRDSRRGRSGRRADPRARSPPRDARSPTRRCSRAGPSRARATPGSRPARRRRTTATGSSADRGGRGRARTASPRISNPMTAATVRWIHSIQALVSSSGRDQLAVAERPVGAAKAGIGGAHDHADRDQPESGREGQRGELLEAVHGPPFYPGGRFRPSAIP